MNIAKKLSLNILLDHRNPYSGKSLDKPSMKISDESQPQMIRVELRRTLRKGIAIPAYIQYFYWSYAFHNFAIACKYLVNMPIDFIASIINGVRPIFGIAPIKHTSFLACLIAIGYYIVTLQLSFLDVSVLYHSFRGQSAVKLYGAGLAIEICEKILTYGGLNLIIGLTKILENSTSWRKVIPQIILSGIYLMAHFFILYLDFTLYIIVLNSQPKNMLIYFFVINLGKMKNAVFKKFEQNTFRKNIIYDAKDRFLKITYSLCFIIIHWQRTTIENIYQICLVLFYCTLIDYLRHFSSLSMAGKQSEMTKIYEQAVDQFQKDEERQVERCGKWDFAVIPYILLLIKLIHIGVKANNLQARAEVIYSQGYFLLLIYVYLLHPFLKKILFKNRTIVEQ